MKKATWFFVWSYIIADTIIASAAPFELNIYASDSQLLFLNSLTQDFLQFGLGCTATAPVMNKYHAISIATNCTSTLVPINSYTNKRDIDFRVSADTSAEGMLALKKLAPIDSTYLQAELKSDGSAGDGIGDNSYPECNTFRGERAMYYSSTQLICKPVHIAISDVESNTLVQKSSGQKLGPMGGGRFYPALPTTGISINNLWVYTTVAVPFGFFVNKAVTATKCSAGLVGNYCTANSQCNTTPTATDGVCSTTPTTIDTISRSEVNQIFGGQAYDWSDFGAYFTAQPVVACLRHAGSGAHAAFDATVMNGAGWGVPVAQVENTDNSMGPITWFNRGRTDLIKCVNGATTTTTTGSLIGAIGYAVADEPIGVPGVSQNVKAIRYNGVWPSRATIRNGSYDYYTMSNHIVPSYSEVGYTIAFLAEKFRTYLTNPNYIPLSKANYWASKYEMKFYRTDMQYPVYSGATVPMLP